MDDLFNRQQKELEAVHNRYAMTTNYPYRTDPDIFDMKQMDLRELKIKHDIENKFEQQKLREDIEIKKPW